MMLEVKILLTEGEKEELIILQIEQVSLHHFQNQGTDYDDIDLAEQNANPIDFLNDEEKMNMR